jgi:alkylation response protein AidB-like acyl-CoA dehydrogenase
MPDPDPRPDRGELNALRDSVRGLLARHPEPGGLPLWRRLCTEIGVAGLAVPERFGGAGAGPAEVGVVQEELGRVLADTPMLGSAVLATETLLASGDEAACARLLPELADGSQVAALAWTTAAGAWDPGEVACRAVAAEEGATADGDWQLDGEAHYVLDGELATTLLVPAKVADGIGLFEVQPAAAGVTVSAATTMDQTRRLATVQMAGAGGRRIGGPAGRGRADQTRAGQTRAGQTRAALARARDLACIALAAEQAGAAARALEITVEYTKTRVQFGRPIGSFQALQHRMADLHVLVQAAGSVARAAADAAGPGAPDLALRAATAKAYCSEALQVVTAEMLQLHGAIAMTWEHEAHRYFKRAHGAAMLLGTPAAHVERVAAAVIDG